MKPKNDKDKYRKKSKFGAQMPPKMDQKSIKILSQKMFGKYVQKGRDGQTGTSGNQPCHTKGGDCLGISPPDLKGSF